MINRRAFLGGLAALVGGVVLEEAIPFNRVWSFPKEIKIAPLSTIYYNPKALETFNYAFVSANITQYHDFVTISDLPAATAIFSARGPEAGVIRSLIRRGWTNGEMKAVEIFETS